ncbi:MAG: acyl-CoA dehydrogenase family protein [Chloroflexi bacterium]|nr:acyl-CoA dehydrogenase family protein [Chloroflexota bacterium]
MANITSTEVRNQIVNMVREFVRRDVEPIANQYDDEDIYPHELADKMAEMGLFGVPVSKELGGLSLDYLSYGAIRRTTLSNPSGDGLDEFTPTSLTAMSSLSQLNVALPFPHQFSPILLDQSSLNGDPSSGRISSIAE